ncbi:MAG: efflux transporter outer membrane subunit [Prevotella sp.]|nr:efflux transporter outer membrane subunit [Prevotella sp.]MBQ4296155.1 efflux transporter outer membrane subunit [Prevotella sp.]
MNRKYMLIAGACALMLTGCKSVKESLFAPYDRPDVNTRGIIRDNVSRSDTLVASADSITFGRLPWREVFTDPQLQILIQQALDNNVDMLNAALNVQMAETQLKAARLAFLPQFTFSPSGTIASWDFGPVSKTYQLPVAISWNADLFGNLLSQKRSAQMQLLGVRDYQVVVQTNIIKGVANMYYTLLMLDRQLEILGDMTGLTKDTWDLMKLQMSLGRARSTSVQSAEANYYSVQTQAVEMKRQVREVENALSLLMGQPAQAISRGKLANQNLPSKFATGVGIQLLANRADVHYAEMNLAKCFYGIETARSRFYPNLTITPTAAFTNSGGGAVVNPGKVLLSAVASLTQPIFMRGQLTAGLRVAEAQYEQAYNTWQNAVLKAGNEVSDALVLYNASDEKIQLEQKQVETLEKNVEHTRMLFKSSGSTYFEVISAQQALLNAQISLVSDQFYKMQAVVNLYNALGGGGK